MDNMNKLEDIEILSIVQCIDCGNMFSINLDDPEGTCPRCKTKNFKVADVL